MEPLKIFSNSTKLCRTCLKEETNLKNIRDTNITIKNNSKTVLEVLNVLTTIEVKYKLTCYHKSSDEIVLVY